MRKNNFNKLHDNLGNSTVGLSLTILRSLHAKLVLMLKDCGISHKLREAMKSKCFVYFVL